MLTKYLKATTRVALAITLLIAAEPFSSSFRGTEVTLEGIVLTGCIVTTMMLLFKAAVIMITPEPKLVHAMGSMGTAILTKPDTPEKIRHIALHEAGHAVAAIALGHQLISVTIRQKGYRDGQTAWRHSKRSAISFDHLVVAYAGGIADQSGQCGGDASFFNERDDSSDILRGAIAVSTLPGETRSPSQLLDQAHRVARELVTSRSQQIQILTELLIGTERKSDLRGDELTELSTKKG